MRRYIVSQIFDEFLPKLALPGCIEVASDITLVWTELLTPIAGDFASNLIHEQSIGTRVHHAF